MNDSLGHAAPKLALPALPYPDTALAPVISQHTLSFHHGKHHAAYVTNANKLLEIDPLKDSSLDEIVRAAARDKAKAALFNNAAQVWNHTFFWNSLSPNGGGAPTGLLGELVKDSFGDYGNFKQEFAQAATGQFGSGWAWLCLEGRKLAIRKTSNAETPLTQRRVKPLLTIDVWEHAYYLDYQNRRPDYVNAVIDRLLNWNFAETNL